MSGRPSLTALLIIVVVVTGCGPARQEATGLVTNVESTSPADVTGFTLRASDGEMLRFEIGRLELEDGGFPAAHLREHQTASDPVTVTYTREADGRLVAVKLSDAPVQGTTTPAGTGSPPATPTGSQSVSPTAAPATATVGAATASPTAAARTDGAGTPPRLSFQPFARGLDSPVFVTHANDGSGLLYAVEQPGRIMVIDPGGEIRERPFVDLSDRIQSGGERGLLGLAFHPEHADNGLFYVNYTDIRGDTVISELRRVDEGSADQGSERVLLTIDQPFANHNGGMIAFDAAGSLVIATGDGGGAGDPERNGQDRRSLLGKLLRIDVAPAGDRPYRIPDDNPFRDEPGGGPEIWALGLRNPWRFSVDRQTGDLFIGDVGQGTWEEVNAQPAGAGGRNYGWNVMEGPDCFASQGCDRDGLTLPVAWYPTAEGCVVTGGYVYRGAAHPALAGTYLFADFCNGRVFGLPAASAVAGEAADFTELGRIDGSPSSFGEDAAGELYLVDIGGTIYRIGADG